MIVYICFAIVLLNGPSICSAWSYSGPQGPSNWAKLPGAGACNGRKQSPININAYETGQKSFPPFKMAGYKLVNAAGRTRPTSMVNNGHFVQVNLEGNYFLSGGGLPIRSKYKAVQFHLHWGSMNTKGSEHTKNGKAYPAEMHIVHYDSSKYRVIGDAISKPNGLAELGFWIRLGPHNAAWDPIINNLAAIKYANTPFIFPRPFALSSLLPTDLSRFYRYEGSLTTPGCYESVIWTVFDHEIVLSRAQLAKFRQLSKYQTPPYGPGASPELHRRLIDNFRPLQRLWFRTVYQSWPHVSYDYYGGGGAAAGDAGNGWTPKFSGTFAGNHPAQPPRNGPGPARLEDDMEETEDFEMDGYGAYTGEGRGMQRLWNALRNGEYGADQDYSYYEDGYGNNNRGNDESYYYGK